MRAVASTTVQAAAGAARQFNVASSLSDLGAEIRFSAVGLPTSDSLLGVINVNVNGGLLFAGA